MDYTLRAGVLEALDAAEQDNFGAAVAYSQDGLVMAVGASGRDNAGADQGAVYVFDLVGSAWVQRGAVLLAPDADNYALFGTALALSANGLVLVVGARDRPLAGYGSPGGVYVYDRSGSAWVQRGAVLTHGSPNSGDAFGAAVALSGNGLILAVGAPAIDYTYTNQGRVYLFEWSGSAWVGTWSNDLNYPDNYDAYGSAVALSSDGMVLAVGASGWDSAALNQGAVFVFDRNTGGSYIPRDLLAGAPLLCPDALADDQFGVMLALSADGARMLVGTVRYTSSYSRMGTLYVFGWSGSAWVEENPAITPPFSGDGFSSVALSASGSVMAIGCKGKAHSGGLLSGTGVVYVYDIASSVLTGTCTAPTLLTVVSPSGAVSAPTRLTMIASGSVSAPTLLAVVDASDAANWTARCLIDGVDVSARLTGRASVAAEEGAARIASLTLLPDSGVIAPLDYVGKPIVLDYVLLIGGVSVPRRLFTGRIDTPEYNPATTLLHLTCVDDLQNRVAVLPRGVIDGLVGGRYSASVQGEIDDNWDYAVARLSTMAASLDAGASGGMRVTPWELTASWATFDESDLLYERMRLSLPQRSTMINQVDIEFSYRYPRLRQRYTTLGWSGTQIDMAPCGYAYPTQQDLLGAAGGSGWEVTLGVFYPAPAAIPHSSGGFIYPAAGAIDMAILHLTQRHSQTVTETFTLQVNADESIALNGALPNALRGSLESTFDGGAWESALDVAPLLPSGGELDWAPDAPRADADYALDTLLDQARVKILGSHRGARIGNAILCNPDLDLDKRVAIATAHLTASGKVAGVVHVLDFSSGSATSEFELAAFGAGGAGIITPTTLAPPSPPAAASETQDWPSAIPPLFVNTFGVTPYNDNLMGLLLNPPETISVDDIPSIGSQSFPNPSYVAGSYPVTGFRCRMPGVDDADRNPLDKPVSASYSIIVPTDTLTLTVP